MPKSSVFDYFPLKFEKFVVAQSIQLTQQFESFFGESTGFQSLLLYFHQLSSPRFSTFFLSGS